jgi:uncharacterized SAM-binding protein YcdF (DUF218 family)
MKKFWDIILGITLILYIVGINAISNVRIAFSLPIVAIGIILIIYHFIKERIKKSKIISKAYKIIKILLCIGLISFIGIEVAIISYPKYNEKKADYIIVLGAGLANRVIPSIILEGRLDAAIKYIEKNDTAYIVLSGGQGEDEDLPESNAMSKYLQDRGVNKDRIITEDKSRDTNQNLKFSKEKIEEHSHKSIDEINVNIITTDFHAFRSSILAKKNGYTNFENYSSPTMWYMIPVTYTREAFAVVKSVIFDK